MGSYRSVEVVDFFEADKGCYTVRAPNPFFAEKAPEHHRNKAQDDETTTSTNAPAPSELVGCLRGDNRGGLQYGLLSERPDALGHRRCAGPRYVPGLCRSLPAVLGQVRSAIQILYHGAILDDGVVEGLLDFNGEAGGVYYYAVHLRQSDRKPQITMLDAEEGQALMARRSPAKAR